MSNPVQTSEEVRLHGIIETVSNARQHGQATVVIQEPSKRVLDRLAEAGLEWKPAGRRNGRNRIELTIPPAEPVRETFPIEQETP